MDEFRFGFSATDMYGCCTCKSDCPLAVHLLAAVEAFTREISILHKRQHVRKGKKVLATEDGREAAMLSTGPWLSWFIRRLNEAGFLIIHFQRELHDDKKHLTLISWNVNGLGALVKQKNSSEEDTLILSQLARLEDFDTISLREAKLQVKPTLLNRLEDNG